MNFELRGWNECLITYILGASSLTYPITENVYRKCWAEAIILLMEKLTTELNCPLDLIMAARFSLPTTVLWDLNPHGLKDEYADYWEQNYNHTLINYKHCVINPGSF